jgi:hypothetical protein
MKNTEPTVTKLIREGIVCGTCADEGERSCDCLSWLETDEAHACTAASKALKTMTKRARD